MGCFCPHLASFCSTSQLQALIKYCFYPPLRVSFGLVGNSNNGDSLLIIYVISATWKTPFNSYCTPLCIKDIYEKKAHMCFILIFTLNLGNFVFVYYFNLHNFNWQFDHDVSSAKVQKVRLLNCITHHKISANEMFLPNVVTPNPLFPDPNGTAFEALVFSHRRQSMLLPVLSSCF